MTKFELFTWASGQYPEHKARFASFCEFAAKILNGNSSLPGISLAAGADGASAILTCFDQPFRVRFHYYIDGETCVGVIAVYRPTVRSEEELVWHVYFDERGNALKVPNSSTSHYSIWDADFIKELLLQVCGRHFSDLSASFKPKPAASQ